MALKESICLWRLQQLGAGNDLTALLTECDDDEEDEEDEDEDAERDISQEQSNDVK